MNRHTLPLGIALLALAGSAFAQSGVDQRGHDIPTPGEIEANQRLATLLRNPTFITLRLVSIPKVMAEKPTDTPPPYKVGDRIDFQIILSHSHTESFIHYFTLDPYYEFRPELLRDGDLVPFSKKAQEIVEITEKRPHSGSGAPIELVPAREYESSRLNLKNWYEPLGPGRYQLRVRKRFVWDGAWVHSSSVTFEVK